MTKRRANSDSITRSGLLLLLTSITLVGVSLSVQRENTASAKRGLTLARWNETPQVLGAGRGNPWINVRDGQEILTEFSGGEADSDNQQPISISTADFDEDGMPDIVIGYKNGSAALMRGNIDALFPNTPEANLRKATGDFTDASFLSPARVVGLSAKPDFLAAGDFDADGHFDIASASRGEKGVSFFRGDGKGAFEAAKKITLEGNVTSIVAEDINRRDGIHDLIVGMQNGRKGRLLILEHPYGAMNAVPEVFDLDSPPTSISVNFIEGNANPDLVIAAGSEMAVLRGRDRKLLLDESGNSAEVATFSRRTFDFQIKALAIGEFIKSENRSPEIALLADNGRVHLLENEGSDSLAGWRKTKTVSLPADLSGGDLPVMLTARVSARSVDTLVIGIEKQIHLLTSDFTNPRSQTEPVHYDTQTFELQSSLDATSKIRAILPMRLNIDALSDLVVMKDDSVAPTVVQTVPMATFEVDTTSLDADFENNGICCIGPLVAGSCTSGCSLRAAIEQGNLMSGSLQINFNILTPGVPTIGGGTYSSLAPVVINGASQPGGLVEITGTMALPVNIFTGSQTDNCVFRGLVINGVGGNYYLNPQALNNIIEGNRIGTNAAGTVANGSPVNNTGGIAVGGANLIGGTTVAARNIISTGAGEGIGINGISPGNPLLVQGNYIGTDITGTIALGNFGNGVRLQDGNLTIGGTTAGAGNVISATTGDANFGANGIRSPGGGIGTLVQGNRIGTNAAGTAALGNARFGIEGYNGTPFDTIGGTTPAARNIISGNGLDGIENSSTGASTLTQRILGNYIGTNATGNVAIPNGGFGIDFGGVPETQVSNNLVSGNTGGGIKFCCNNAGSGDVISNNLIGTDFTGDNPLGNGGVGLSISNESGGATQAGIIMGNTIAANGSHGVLVDNGYNLVFENNFIGTSAALSQTLGNGGDGMRFVGAFDSNRIGGANSTIQNTIISNTGNGINLASENIFSVANFIDRNRIFTNGGLGIDLGNDGITANDNCDAENGVNNLQNYPVIQSVVPTGTVFQVNGFLNSAPDQNYTIRFFGNHNADPSGFGEGRTFLGSTTVTTPAGCQVNFTTNLPLFPTGNGRCVSATATDAQGNTSEFSQCAGNTLITRRKSDFDGDGKSDVAIFRPSNGQWWYLRSSDGVTLAATFGESSDRITPGDFTGDGQTDIAFWRPSTGSWYILRSEDSTFYSFPFGTNGDIPAPGDFDGDGNTDAAVFRPSTSVWYVQRSSTGTTEIQPFGLSQDKPVVGDYDGDGKADIAIFRPNGTSGAEWWYRRSSDSVVLAFPFGSSTDIPVQGDFTGDGKTDVAFWRPSTGFWFVLRSEDYSFFAFPWGVASDIPAPGDYDGDGKFDAAIFRPSGATWFLRRSTDGTQIFNFGLSGDRPVPSAFVPCANQNLGSWPC